MLTACRTEWLGDRQEGYGSTLLDLRTLEAFRSSSDAYSSQEPASQSYRHPVRIKWSRGQVAAGTRVWPLDLLTYSLWDIQTQPYSICGRDQQSFLTEPLSSSLLKLEDHPCRHPGEEADWGGIDSQGRNAGGILCFMQARHDRFHSWDLSKDLHFRIHVFSFSQSPASELGDRLCLSNKRLRRGLNFQIADPNFYHCPITGQRPSCDHCRGIWKLWFWTWIKCIVLSPTSHKI